MTLSDGTTTYEFILLPKYITPIRPEKRCADVETYTSAAFFSWGVSIIGKPITLLWNAMPAAMFAALDAFYAGDKSLVWNPTLAGEVVTTYNVEMKKLDGDYLFGGYDTVAATSWRENVDMVLKIMSVAT